MITLFESLSDLTNLTQDALWTAFLVFIRVGAAMALLPAFGERAVPQRIRLLLSLCFSVIIFPTVIEQFPTTDTTFALSLTVEVIAGLAIGIALRLFVLALQIAGTLAAQATSLSQLFGGQGGEPQPSMSSLFVVTGLALAVMAGLHIRIVEVFMISYEVIPPGVFPDGSGFASWGISQVSNAFSLAFSLASPFIAASLIYNIALGVINRAMPQLMVVFVGAPALALGGLALLTVATPLMLGFWVKSFHSFLASPFTVAP